MSILSFGEMLKRNTVHDIDDPSQIDFKKNDYEKCYGGSEANVLMALSRLGESTSYVTALPKGEDGDNIVKLLNDFNVNTDNIKRTGSKLGQYFLLPKARKRSDAMIYDRDDSSVTKMTRDALDFDSIFKGVELFHISGISFSLKGNMTDTSFAFLEEARNKDIPVSFDFNYRVRLWEGREKDASPLFKKILPFCSIILASRKDMETFLSYSGTEDEIAKQYFHDYPNTKYLILRNRKQIRNNLHFVDCSIHTKEEHISLPHPIYFNVKERVGGGDSFDAGILYALIHSYSLTDTLYYGVSSFILKHQMKGDIFIGDHNMVKDYIDNELKRRKRICLSISSLDPSFAKLKDDLDELADIDVKPVDVDDLKGYDIFIGKKMSEKALSTADRLKIVFAYKTGVDDFPLAKLKEMNVIVSNSHADSNIIAEYAFGLSISLVNKITESDRKLRQGIWYDKDNLYWESLFRKKVGLLGYGHIGKEIHKILLNNHIETYTIDRHHDYQDIKLVQDFDELVSTCDVIICSLPKTNDTTYLFNKDIFEKMKGKYIINVGRSNCINQKDLYYALLDHKLSGAAIDTWDKKPSTMDELLLPSIYPLHTLENILVSPHQAMKVIDGHHRYVMDVLENVKRYLSGDELENIVDLTKGY